MEKRLKRLEIGSVIAIILIAFNLGYTIYQGNNNEKVNSFQISKEVPKEVSLPDDLSTKSMGRILTKIKKDYNSEDWLGIYNVLGNYSKAIITKGEVAKEFRTLIKATGKINSYNYSHYQYLGFEEGANWFSVYYKCGFERGSGVIKLSFRTIEDESEVVGFTINLGELTN
jgi:hypothetical protein